MDTLSKSTAYTVENFDLLPDSALVRIAVVAAVLGVHVDTVRRWVKAGKLPPPRRMSAAVVGYPVAAIRAFAKGVV